MRDPLADSRIPCNAGPLAGDPLAGDPLDNSKISSNAGPPRRFQDPQQCRTPGTIPGSPVMVSWNLYPTNIPLVWSKFVRLSLWIIYIDWSGGLWIVDTKIVLYECYPTKISLVWSPLSGKYILIGRLVAAGDNIISILAKSQGSWEPGKSIPMFQLRLYLWAPPHTAADPGFRFFNKFESDSRFSKGSDLFFIIELKIGPEREYNDFILSDRI